MKLDLLFLFVAVLFSATCISSELSAGSSCLVPECISNRKDDLSSAILCSDCIKKALSNSLTARSLNDFRIQLKSLENNENYGPKKITDLNADIFLTLFEMVDVKDMLSLMKIHPALPAIAHKIFRTNFKDSTLTVEVFPLSTELGTDKTTDTYSDQLIVHQFEIARKLLKYFGSSIQQLEIKSSVEIFPSQFRVLSIISQLIYKYGNLKALHLDNINADTFLHFDRPLESLEKLSFEASRFIGEIKTTDLPFNRLFPNIRSLEVDLIALDTYTWARKNLSFLFCEFEYLNHLKLITVASDQQNVLEEIMSRNSQIKSLEVRYMTSEVYNLIQKYIPNLENLKVTCESRTNEVRFNHLTTFHVRNIQPDQIQHLNLPKAEVLHIHYNLQMYREWMPMIATHRHVKHLKIMDIFRSDYSEMIKMIEDFGQLKEITFFNTHTPTGLWYKDTVEVISLVIKADRQKSLQKLNLLDLQIFGNQLGELQNTFGDDWKITMKQNRRIYGDVTDFFLVKK